MGFPVSAYQSNSDSIYIPTERIWNLRDSPTGSKVSTGHFLNQSVDWCRPFKFRPRTQKEAAP